MITGRLPLIFFSYIRLAVSQLCFPITYSLSLTQAVYSPSVCFLGTLLLATCPWSIPCNRDLHSVFFLFFSSWSLPVTPSQVIETLAPSISPKNCLQPLLLNQSEKRTQNQTSRSQGQELAFEYTAAPDQPPTLVVTPLVLLCFAKLILSDVQKHFLIIFSVFSESFANLFLVPPAPLFSIFLCRPLTSLSQPSTTLQDNIFAFLTCSHLPGFCLWPLLTTLQMSPDSDEIIFPKSVPLCTLYNVLSAVPMFLYCIYSPVPPAP